jgi:hypothetical protein
LLNQISQQGSALSVALASLMLPVLSLALAVWCAIHRLREPRALPDARSEK